MKRILALTVFISVTSILIKGQNKTDYSMIDKMLIYGEFERAYDTCRLILSVDSTNADLWYKQGLAAQNLMPDTASFNCFMQAYEKAPENRLYKFTVAKGYFNKGKNRKADALFTEPCSADSMNWQYAHYLTSLYIQQGK